MVGAEKQPNDILPFVKFVGKTTLNVVDDSRHNSLDYRWLNLGLDNLWCNTRQKDSDLGFNTAHLGMQGFEFLAATLYIISSVYTSD